MAESPVKEFVRFPELAYRHVWEGMTKLPSWLAYPDKMAELLEKIAIIEENGQRCFPVQYLTVLDL